MESFTQDRLHVSDDRVDADTPLPVNVPSYADGLRYRRSDTIHNHKKQRRAALWGRGLSVEVM